MRVFQTVLLALNACFVITGPYPFAFINLICTVVLAYDLFLSGESA